MLELGTSGSVGGEGGNLLAYPAGLQIVAQTDLKIANERAKKESVMSAIPLTRRDVLATSAAMSVVGLLPKQVAAADDATMRSFRINVAEEALVDLRRRISATRWPDKETVADQSQGAQLAKLQELMRYWGTGYDWRKIEAKLNALPQFVTMIEGLDIHFIHVRSRHPDALPVIITHGWPGSIIEQLLISQ